MKRRTFVAGALATVAAAPALAQTPALLTLNLTGTSADDTASVLYAEKAGLFRAAGLDTVYQRASSGAAAVAAIVGGAADIGKSSMGSIITARARGIDIKLVVGGALFRAASQRGEVLLIVPSDSALRTARDFNGKTIAVPSLGDQNTMAMRAWVDAGRGDSHSLAFVEVPSNAAAAAVAQGRVAAAVLAPPFAARAIADGKMRSLGAIFSAVAPRFLETGWFTTAAYATKNRDVCLRFAKIVGDASEYVNTHNAEVADSVAAFTGFTTDVIMQNGISYLATSTDAREVQPLIDAMAKYGLIDHRIDASDLIFK